MAIFVFKSEFGREAVHSECVGGLMKTVKPSLPFFVGGLEMKTLLSKIIEEKWNGKEYWLKAEITADPKKVAKAVDSLRKDRQRMKGLEEANRMASQALREVEKLKKELSSTKKTDKAKLKQYNKVIDGLSAVDWIQKADSLSNAGKLNEALLAINKAIELDPDAKIASQCYMHRGFINIQIYDDYDKAIADADKAVELDPGMKSYMGRYMISCGQGFLLSKGYPKQAASCFKKALSDMDRMIQLDPNSGSGYRSRAFIYRQLGNNQRALSDLNKAIELDPRDALAYFRRGNVKGETGDVMQSVSDYDKALELLPEYRQRQANLRGKLTFMKSADQSCADLQKKAYCGRGLADALLGNYKLAIDDFSKAIKLDSSFVKAYTNRSLSYLSMGNYQNAMKDANRVVELDLDNYQSYDLRSLVCVEIRDYQNALKDCTKAIELNPQRYQTYSFRGSVYSRLGNYELALRDMNKAIEIHPGDAADYLSRGIIFEKMGNYSKAIADIKVAARLGHKEAQDYLISQGVAW
jgi:tetratricopeptide (TPR) repeat protein